MTDVAGAAAAGVIHTEDLTKVYPGADFAAVDKLNLDVRTGEIFGLLGPNGAGKTTTAGMLTTRVVPTSGRALLAGIDVATHPALAKQLSGIVSQQNTLDRQLTVWENLYFHGRLFGIGARDSRRIASELLEQFQLSRWAKASVYALSGGMAQRLMVARAIFHRPSVLFLDEPTAGLDPQSRLALWDLLGELGRIALGLDGDDGVGADGLLEPGGGVEREDLPSIHDRHAVAELVGFLHVMRGQKDCLPGGVQLAEDLPQR